MDTFRKWLNKPKADDKSLLARFYHADRVLTAVASELDSFDGRAEPDRCSRLVSRLRQGQDKVLAITNQIMEELLGEDRDARSFRAKFPEEILQENLAGQLWFGAECLAAGSSIMNREEESKEMRPLAQAVTKSLDNVRTLLRDQCLRNNVPNSKTLHLDLNDSSTEQLYESLKIFDRLFAEFEMRYVSAMVQVKSKQEYEMQELICVLFSETLQRALKIGLIEQEKVDAFDPALMFSIPRLAIIAGLVVYPKGPLNIDMPAEELSEMFRPFRMILIKIRDLLRNLRKRDLHQLEKLLCTTEDHTKIPLGTSSIEAPVSVEETNNLVNNNHTLQSSTILQSNSTNTTKDENPATTTTTNTTTTNVNNNINATDGFESANESANNNERPDDSFKDSDSEPFKDFYDSSMSSLSSESSPNMSPVHSSTPSNSEASTSFAPWGQNNWSDDDGDNEDPNDNEDSYDDPEGELERATNELRPDIVSADFASGYLIPNTNFGNLLQPQEAPLTGNFVANQSLENDALNDFDEERPTTSAAIVAARNNLSRLHLNPIEEQNLQNSLNETITNKSLTKEENDENELKSTNDEASVNNKIQPSSPNSSRSSSSGDSEDHNSNRLENSANEFNHTRAHRTSHSRYHYHHYNHPHTHRSTRGHPHPHHHHYHRHHHSQHHRQHRRSVPCRSFDCITCKEMKERIEREENEEEVESTNTLQETSSFDSNLSSSSSEGGLESHKEAIFLKRQPKNMKYRGMDSLLHRLFVCIAGVADQLQTNFAADLRHILRSVFLMNMSLAQEEIDIPEKPKESELFEFRASENDVIQENAGSNQSIYSAEEVNPESDNVFHNPNPSSNVANVDNNARQSERHSTGAVIQRNATIDVIGGGNAEEPSVGSETTSNRSQIGRTRSLGDDANANENSVNQYNRRIASQNGNLRCRNNSFGSNISSTSSEDNSVASESVSTARPIVFLAPPEWIPDGRAPRCMSCETPFTAFRRRHHCRNCGGVFCRTCSNTQTPLPKYGLTKAVRVCRDCYVREIHASSSTTNARTMTAGGS